MTKILVEKEALESLQKRHDNYSGFKEDVELEYTKLLIGKQIYEARQEAALTQIELAELVGTKQSAIARLESADYESHSIPMLQKIASILNKRIEVRFVSLDEN